MLIEEVVAQAGRIEKHIAVAVIRPEGELIAFVRMDEASAAATVAHNKAYAPGTEQIRGQ